ncbi:MULTISPECIES: type II toxin-antitoxin system antitoxin SocA domain-containing protein [Spirulina sp. CCY15215]|uniref:Panacea domain-containing protein n=1 Tax=Spirulina sp. CCY15215 TaxID=2767591 RepID=UPI0019522AD6|nr:type II toxin-antitoxin system antitoxin SocA domain-containing protein [Spirulina major]
MVSARDVAEYFLALADNDNGSSGELISNLKLQKLLYYAQGLYLALFDRPLFPEQIESWIHGPVVPEIYYYYKQYGSGSLPFPENFDYSKFDDETKEVLEEVYEVYGQFSAWKLRNLAHNEPPSKNTSPGSEIPLDSLKEHFKTQLV